MPTGQAVIVGGNRTPFVKAGGAYAQVSNQDMLTAALNGLVARFGLAGAELGEVVAGAVLKHTRDFNLTREAVLGSALSAHTPAADIQQACGTGLETVVYLANKIRLGQVVNGIAGGVDSASDTPIVASEGLRLALLKANRARTLADRLKAFAKLRPEPDADPAGCGRGRTGLSMGESQAITTRRWGITREDQDALALASHQNLARAWDAGFFDDLVTPFLGVSRDTVLRTDTTAEKLASLKPVFGTDQEGASMTAGNSTALTDGAALVLLAQEEWARKHNWPMLARFVDAQVAAADFATGAEDLLLAPTRAIPVLLERNGLTLDDFDLYEFREAFAATVLATLKSLEQSGVGTIDRSRLNVNGSSLAAGHPFAATGARIVASTAKMLSERGSGSRALISICAAGGQGVVAILEAV